MGVARYSRDDWQDGDMCLGSHMIAAGYSSETGKMATCT
jgi:hypothetical protein